MVDDDDCNLKSTRYVSLLQPCLFGVCYIRLLENEISCAKITISMHLHDKRKVKHSEVWIDTIMVTDYIMSLQAKVKYSSRYNL